MSDITERLARLETETKAQTELLKGIAKDVKAVMKEQSDHNLEDAKQFGSVTAEIEKLKSDLTWTKKIGGFLITAGGAFLHWLHLK